MFACNLRLTIVTYTTLATISLGFAVYSVAGMADVGIGIDFGTSNCSIAVCRRNNAVECVPIRNKGLLPSYVSYSQQGVKTGHVAEQQMAENAANTIYQVKRILGVPWNDEALQRSRTLTWPFKLINENSEVRIELDLNGQRRRITPEEVVAELLKSLLETARKYLSRTTIKKAVITVPAHFDAARRQAMLNAARLSGLHDVSFISEPTAAVLAVDLAGFPTAQHILVFDFGGGTLDLSLVKRTVTADNVTEYEVLAVGGNMNLGGMNFDEALVRHVAYQVTSEFYIQLEQVPNLKGRIIQQCELAKHKVCNSTKPAHIALEIQPGLNFESTISRSEFLQINQNNLNRIIPAIRSVLATAALTVDQVDVVVMVGGSSRIPRVQEILREFFGQDKVVLDTDPDHAIAIGAAKSANISNMREAGLPPIITWKEVMPWCLGVETEGGRMRVLIRKGQQLPATGHDIFKLTNQNARNVQIKIWEGDYERAAMNYYLGELNLPEIQENNDHCLLEVVFEYDRSRTLRVHVKGRNMSEDREITLQGNFTSSRHMTDADANDTEPKHLSVAQAKQRRQMTGVYDDFSDLSDSE